MPELPDVEGFRRVLADHAVGRRIRGVNVVDRGVLKGVSASRLSEELTGSSFGSPWRHGKWLVVPVTGARQSMILHFGMTGGLFWCENEQRNRHDRVVVHFDNGDLSYQDMRKLQGVRLALPEDVLAELGPDALELSREDLRSVLGGQKRQIKAAPSRKSWLTGRRDEESGSCPRCGTLLEHGRVNGRGTAWCPRCQGLPHER